MQYLAALLSIILGAIAQYLFKIGATSVFKNSKELPQIIREGATNPYLTLGILSYGFSFILWFYVLSKMELSKAYPLVSLGYIFTLFFGYYFLNETITPSKIIGISLIMIGVFVLTC